MGTGSMPAGALGMEQMGHVVGAEQKVRDSTQMSQRDIRSRCHAGEPEGERVAQTGGNHVPRPKPGPVVAEICLLPWLIPCSPRTATFDRQV